MIKKWLWAAGLVALLGTHGLAYYQGGASAREDAAVELRKQADQDRKEMMKLFKLLVDAQERATAAEQKLSEELNKPPVAPEVRTVVRENPSKCVVPKPVDDKLRESRREANASIRSTLSPR